MGLKGGQLSTMFLCILQSPYKVPGLEPTALVFLCCITLKAPDDFKDFKYLLICFSWFTGNFSKPFLVSTFSNLPLLLRSDSVHLI